METISLKLEKGLLKEIETKMKKHHYSTKTEFVRDAIRSKIEELENHPLTEDEKKEMMRAVEKLRGISKKKTTDEDLHRIREKAFEELEKKYSQ